MSASLVHEAGDFIAQVLLIPQAPEGALPDARPLQDRLTQALEALRRVPDVAPDELEEARFALVAWADEVVLSSSWSGREQWEAASLQMQLYRTTKAGAEFFDHIAALRPDQHAAREVYFVLLALGFHACTATPKLQAKTTAPRWCSSLALRPEIQRIQIRKLNASV